MDWLILLGLFVYFTIGLLLASSIKASSSETITLLIAWPAYVLAALFVLFFYMNFQMGTLITSRVHRRRKYFERRRKQKKDEKML